MQDHLHNTQEPSCPDAPKVEAVSPNSNSLSFASNSDFAARFDAAKSRRSLGNSGVQSDSEPNICDAAADPQTPISEQSSDCQNSMSRNIGELMAVPDTEDGSHPSPSEQPDASDDSNATPMNPADTSRISDDAPRKKKKSSNPSSPKKKKKKKMNPFVAAWSNIFPYKGDKPLEVLRKLVLLLSLTVFVVCFYLLLHRFIDLYTAEQKYNEIQHEVNEFISTTVTEEPRKPSGLSQEYYEYNDIANKLLALNPDLVGYITIPDTKVNYPVVQKKSADINVNTNNYYLHRAFDQTESKPGCIFMDYRCHFDEVVVHRLSIENSDNLLIYGHNMKDESMFGTLKYYQRNVFSDPEKDSYYSQHPNIVLHSLYKTYNYKIFAIFLVDGEDTDSEYAFDCWNTFDFEDEDSFYSYVNNAKRRNIVNNNVDVTYGDQLLTLYTCSSMIPNGKLIVMARMLRPGEDPLEGTQNGYLNDNILWPEAYYKYRNVTPFDESQFVPYGKD